MLKPMLTAALSLSLLAGLSLPAAAAPCRDAHGKFAKCPPKPALSAVRCRNGKGQFAKCGTPGAKPAK